MDIERPSPVLTARGKLRGYYLSGPIALMLLLGIGGTFFGLPGAPRDGALPTDALVDGAATTSAAGPAAIPVAIHVPMPDEVRGIYWTGYTAGSERADALLAYASSSHLNSVVIDVKLDDGTLAFVPRDPALSKLTPADPAIRDLDSLLGRLKTRGIYRIARLAVMRDRVFGELHPDVVLRNPEGGVWRDKTGLPWLDPASSKVADYALALAREAYARGFDEIQFDYVRFASDGRLSAIRYPVYDGKRAKAEVMRDFFERVGGTLQRERVPVSFDLFGLTFWTQDDLNIGQRLLDVYPFADAISPMVYPSHYARGFEGFANPALYPYEVVKRTLDKGIGMLLASDPPPDPNQAKKKVRPWIQDFNLGAKYDAAKVEAQIKAARDAGASGWMIWNAGNVYTAAIYQE